MTYKATLLDSRALAAGLIKLEPITQGVPEERRIYVTQEVHDVLQMVPDRRPNLPYARALQVMNSFIIGECTWGCLTKDPEPDAEVDFKRLIGADEV